MSEQRAVLLEYFSFLASLTPNRGSACPFMLNGLQLPSFFQESGAIPIASSLSAEHASIFSRTTSRPSCTRLALLFRGGGDVYRFCQVELVLDLRWWS